jgi:hypothetical protein
MCRLNITRTELVRDMETHPSVTGKATSSNNTLKMAEPVRTISTWSSYFCLVFVSLIFSSPSASAFMSRIFVLPTVPLLFGDIGVPPCLHSPLWVNRYPAGDKQTGKMTCVRTDRTYLKPE